MATSKRAEFLNVDFDILSTRPLDALVRAFDDKKKTFLLHAEDGRGKHRASFEVMRMTKTAETTIREIVRVVSVLPRDAAAQWKRSKRILDIGVQAKVEGAAIVRITPAMMKAAASIGADIVVTVYPERPP